MTTAMPIDLRGTLAPIFRRRLLKTLRALDPGCDLEPRVTSTGNGTWDVRSADGSTWREDDESEARHSLDRHLISLARSAACEQAVTRGGCLVGKLQDGEWRWTETTLAEARKIADLALVAGVPCRLAPIAEDYTP